MTARIDVSALYRRIGRLQAIVDAGSLLVAAACYQAPLITDAQPGYWHVGEESMADFRTALERAAAAGDHAAIGAQFSSELVAGRSDPPADQATVIRLPYAPNRAFSANKATRGHWQANADLMRSEKERAIRALSMWQQDEPFYVAPVAITVRVAWGKSLHVGKARAGIAQDRPLDWDGLTLCLKPIMDALTAVKIWADDRLVGDARLVQSIDDAGEGWTEVAIWHAEAAS